MHVGVVDGTRPSAGKRMLEADCQIRSTGIMQSRISVLDGGASNKGRAKRTQPCRSGLKCRRKVVGEPAFWRTSEFGRTEQCGGFGTAAIGSLREENGARLRVVESPRSTHHRRMLSRSQTPS